MKKMSRFAVVGSALLFSSIGAVAKGAQPGYRVFLAGGATVMARDVPVQRGTILTFHQASNGVLTGVPIEAVVSVQVDAAPRTRTIVSTVSTPSRSLDVVSHPLEPGQTLVIGATGDGVPAQGSNATAGLPPSGGNPTNPALYGGFPATGPNGVATAASSTDLSQALSSTTGANGFPSAPANSPTVIGPNGTPTLAPGMPGANTTIGANGTPVVPGVPQPAVGANGTPVLAPASSPGAGQTTIGPNGTPVLASPGTPGSAPAPIGSNGTPVLAPAGSPGAAAPSTAPNGTPSAPAQGGHH
jgi:hypothetical protein